MVTTPVATEVAMPVAPMVATAGADEVHVTDDVRFCVVPSVKVPVAVNCSIVPSGIDTLPGATEIEVRIADVTVRFVWPETLPDVAVIVTVPT